MESSVQQQQPNTKIGEEDYDKNKKYAKHPYAHKNGGFHMSYIEDKMAASVYVKVVKSLAKKILMGEIKNVMALSKPTEMCFAQTLLEVTAQDQRNTQLLDLAAQPNTDGLRKLQLVTTYIISNLVNGPEIMFTKIPIDPLIGETVQLEKKNGTAISGECILFEENLTGLKFFFSNKEKSWKGIYSYLLKGNLQTNLNRFVGHLRDKRYFEFSDGTIIEATNPHITVEGFLYGDRIINQMQSFEVCNMKSNMKAVVTFNFDPTKEGNIKKIANAVGNGISKLTSFLPFKNHSNQDEEKKEKVDIDTFTAKIYKVNNLTRQQDQDLEEDNLQALISEGSGNWLSYVQFDNKIFWKITDNYERYYKPSFLLPSDSSLRKDREFISRMEFDKAQQQKLNIQNINQFLTNNRILNNSEERQRQDNILRKKYKKNQQQQ